MSQSSAGVATNGDSYPVDISADGRYIGMTSYGASTLAPNDNDEDNVYRHDRQTGTTEVASIGTGWDGTALVGDAYGGRMSADGALRGLHADAPTVSRRTTTTPSATSSCATWPPASTQLVSLPSGDDGSTVDGGSSGPVISPDGRFVAFTSEAENLVAGDTNGVLDVFLRTVLRTRRPRPQRLWSRARPSLGRQLTCNDGVWTEGTLTRVWRRNEQPISGATGATYTLIASMPAT